jgi:hypothetical protein
MGYGRARGAGRKGVRESNVAYSAVADGYLTGIDGQQTRNSGKEKHATRESLARSEKTVLPYGMCVIPPLYSKRDINGL